MRRFCAVSSLVALAVLGAFLIALLVPVRPEAQSALAPAHTVLAGPTSGSAAFPAPRLLVGTDIPAPGASSLGGIESYAVVSHQWINTISTAGVPGSSQPAFSDIAGTLASTQCPAGTISAIGCLEGDNATLAITAGVIALNLSHANTWLATQTLPNNSLTFAELPSFNANTVLSNWSGSPGAPIANTWPACASDGGHALTYTNGTGVLCTVIPSGGTVTEQKNTFGYGITSSGNCDNTTTNAGSPCNGAVSLTSASNVLGSDVTMNNTSNYFTGPSMAQGTTGTWLVFGNATVTDTTAAEVFDCKLWDGTNAAINSSQQTSVAASNGVNFPLHGIVTNPSGNMRISCRDSTATTGLIKFNMSGNSADSAIWGIRIQ